MKLPKITSAIMALALIVVLSSTARAQLLNYNQGDVLIGFENGGGNNYVVDLGAASQFINATGPLTFSLSTGDLTTAFGGSWASNSGTVQWGVIGGNATNTLFATQGRPNAGTQTTAPFELTNSGNNGINSNIQSFAADFQGETPSSGSTLSLQATVESSAGSESWSSNNPSLSAFGLTGGVEQPSTGSFTGPTDSVLDLYELSPAAHINTTRGTYLGDFTLSSDGTLTFNAAAPEPSTYALMALGLGVLTWHLRRKGSSIL